MNEEASYAFNLYFTCAGFAYYATYTHWAARSAAGRQVRQPSIVVRSHCVASLYELGQTACIVENMADYGYWVLHRGWAIVSKTHADAHMIPWLEARECIESPFDCFTDVVLTSNHSTKHRVPAPVREKVIERDGTRCLMCGKELPADQTTMHHVTPFSRGGETTAGNLVVLCSHCNQAVGTDELPHLYDLAGLPHSVDPSIMKGEKSAAAFREAIKLSGNMMYSRCILQ